jgi:hypothetical protein
MMETKSDDRRAPTSEELLNLARVINWLERAEERRDEREATFLAKVVE